MVDIKKTCSDIKDILIPFIKNPMEKIRNLPDWDWQTLILAQVLVTAISGALGGLINRSVLSILSGLIMMPILTLITTSISTLFFFYTFQIIIQKQVPYRKLFTVVFFANIPFFIFQIISGYFPPISLVGLAFTGLLLIVGFVENFQVPRKLVIRLIAALYVVFFLIWLWGRLDTMKLDKQWRAEESAPEVRLGK
ncbi:MAG: hypothetical protein BroJett040_15270 [Oligoflexia bacterium]|nr:MAG: hypothetical protein BroJett040_15270 [Oligoflexia bacterium]